MNLENIKMIPGIGRTKVIDGAGLLQNGFYFMSPEEIKEMARKRNSIEYQLTKKVREVIQRLKYQ